MLTKPYLKFESDLLSGLQNRKFLKSTSEHDGVSLYLPYTTLDLVFSEQSADRSVDVLGVSTDHVFHHSITDFQIEELSVYLCWTVGQVNEKRWLKEI